MKPILVVSAILLTSRQPQDPVGDGGGVEGGRNLNETERDCVCVCVCMCVLGEGGGRFRAGDKEREGERTRNQKVYCTRTVVWRGEK